MKEVLIDTALDCLKLIPMLLIAYLAMEFIEEKIAAGSEKLIHGKGAKSVFAGALVGVVPQCGFAAAAASLFAGGIISCGTLIAVFISSSDEMLPILISQRLSFGVIGKILTIKVLSALVIGILAEFTISKKIQLKPDGVSDICKEANCNCENDGIFICALRHTAKILVFIFIFSLILNTLVELVGTQALAGMIIGKAYISEIISALIGLIPNCASSVILTQLFVQGVLPSGALISGLCVNSGVGLLVLFRTNRRLKENLKITLFMFVCSVAAGCLIELLEITFR